MPYGRYRRRRYIRRRRPYRKVPWYARKYNAMQLASAAWRGVKYIKGLVNAEVHKFDGVISESPLNTGTIVPLSEVAQGDTDQTRTGNSIFAKMVDVRVTCTRNASGDTSQLIRLSLVRDNQAIADTDPSFADIYEGLDINSHLNNATVGRFTILATKTVVLDSVGQPATQVRLLKKMRKHVRYNGTAGSDVQKNGLFLVLVSSQTTANAPTVAGGFRLSYYDN